jgi:CMP-N-acetylneuraminic acid synthetase
MNSKKIKFEIENIESLNQKPLAEYIVEKIINTYWL